MPFRALGLHVGISKLKKLDEISVQRRLDNPRPLTMMIGKIPKASRCMLHEQASRSSAHIFIQWALGAQLCRQLCTAFAMFFPQHRGATNPLETAVLEP